MFVEKHKTRKPECGKELKYSCYDYNCIFIFNSNSSPSQHKLIFCTAF